HQRQRLADLLAEAARPVARGDEHVAARAAGHHPRAAVPVRSAAALGPDGDAPLLHQDGLFPLHAAGHAAAVHGGAADQDGGALDDEPEVHRGPPGNLLQHLGPPWLPPTRLIATRRPWTSSSASPAA